MEKKITGIIFLLAGAWGIVEGQGARVLGIIGAVSGFFLFFEGLKQEIIEAIKRKEPKELE